MNANYEPHLVQIRKKKEANQIVQQGCSIYLGEEYCRGDWNLAQSKWYTEDYANKPAKYADYLNNNDELKQQIYQLAGQDLGCWCNGQKQKTCHGNYLVQLTKEWLSEYFENILQKNLISSHSDLSNSDSVLSDSISSNSISFSISPQQRYNLIELENDEIPSDKIPRDVIPSDKIPTTPSDKILSDKILSDKSQRDKIPNNIPNNEPNNKTNNKPNEKTLPILCWDKKAKKWQLPPDRMNYDRMNYDGTNYDGTNYDGINYDGMNYDQMNNNQMLTLPCDMLLQYDDLEWERPAGSRVTTTGYVHFDIKLMDEHPKNEHPKNEHPIDETYRKLLNLPHLPNITKGYLGKLNNMLEPLDSWEPFVCVVKGRLQHRKTGKYMLSLWDEENTYKVHVGQKLYGVIKEKFIDVNDTIKVTQYVSSKITTQRRIIIIYDFVKIEKGA